MNLNFIIFLVAFANSLFWNKKKSTNELVPDAPQGRRGIFRKRRKDEWEFRGSGMSLEEKKSVMLDIDKEFTTSFLKEVMEKESVNIFTPVPYVMEKFNQLGYNPLHWMNNIYVDSSYVVPFIIGGKYDRNYPYLYFFVASCDGNRLLSKKASLIRSFTISNRGISPLDTTSLSNGPIYQNGSVNLFEWNTKSYFPVSNVCFLSVMTNKRMRSVYSDSFKERLIGIKYRTKLSLPFEFKDRLVFTPEWFKYQFGSNIMASLFGRSGLYSFKLLDKMFNDVEINWKKDVLQLKRYVVPQAQSLFSYLQKKHFEIKKYGKNAVYGFNTMMSRYVIRKLREVPFSFRILNPVGQELVKAGNFYLESRRGLSRWRQFIKKLQKRFKNFILKWKYKKIVEKVLKYSQTIKLIMGKKTMNMEGFVIAYNQSPYASRKVNADMFIKKYLGAIQKMINLELYAIVSFVQKILFKKESWKSRFSKFLFKNSMYDEALYFDRARKTIGSNKINLEIGKIMVEYSS